MQTDISYYRTHHIVSHDFFPFLPGWISQPHNIQIEQLGKYNARSDQITLAVALFYDQCKMLPDIL